MTIELTGSRNEAESRLQSQVGKVKQPAYDRDWLTKFAYYMNPYGKDLSLECPQLNAAPLFGSEEYMKIGYPDIHPSVSMWGHDTYITGWVVIDEESAIYPGCNFNADALMPLKIGKRCSLQHVELHYSGFRMLPTVIGDDTFMSHLSFGHSVKIGQGCYILGHVTMYDGAEIGDDVFIEGNSTILGSARLRSGWAYAGVVDKQTKPMCRTSEVVFGIDPKTGESLYIGGKNGVARTVNNSHLSRNANQMRLVAFKNGCPERKEPAHAVTICHVYQTALHYLSLVSQVLEQMAQDDSGLGLAASAAGQLGRNCQELYTCICTIYHGQPADERTRAVWLRRTDIIGQVAEIMDSAQKSYVIEMPPLEKKVLQEDRDLRTAARKLREFEAVMQRLEAACFEFYASRDTAVV